MADFQSDTELLSALNALGLETTSRLLALPAELRVQIFQYIYDLPTETTVIDVKKSCPVQRNNHSNADALELSCKQIRHECFNLREYYISAPIFGDSEGPLHPVDRQLVSAGLLSIADNISRSSRLKKSTLFLGYLGSLKKLRWMEMHSCLIRVLEAIMLIRERAPGILVSLRLSVEGGAVVQYSFGIKDGGDVEKGMREGRMRDGSLAVLTEAEMERLERITRTIVRTMFPPRKEGAAEGDG